MSEILQAVSKQWTWNSSMFDSQDLLVFKKEDSWAKVDELGTVFFPKLGALKNKAADLIRVIYGVHANESYKTYQAPTPSNQRRKGVKLDPRDQVTVSFRAKGKPSDLYKPNGTLCQMHFAFLGFGAAYFEDGLELENNSANYVIGVEFQPYILRYDERHRKNLKRVVELYELDKPIIATAGNFLASHEFLNFTDLLLKDKVWVVANLVDLQNITVIEMAELVITCVAFFPILDVFTRLSNGEKLHGNKGNRIIPIESISYKERFISWYSEKASEYIENFEVEPITEEDYWKSEALTRSIFESIFSQKFNKTRPSWLRASKNKESMELDGYNQDLRLAFEYQGEHHYADVFPNQLPYEEIQKNDLKKIEICKKNGVDLIQVPYTEKGDRNYILSKLYELNREDINSALFLAGS